MDLYLKSGLLAVQLFHSVLLREGDHDILGVSGLTANQLILKAGDKGAGTQLQIMVFRLAAIKGLLPKEAFEINGNGIALLRLTIHIHQPGGTLDVGLQLLVDILFGYLLYTLGSGKSLVVAQSDFRTNCHSGLERKALFAGIQQFHFGIGNGVQSLLLHRLVEQLRVDLVNGILIKDFCTVHSLDHLPGGFTLTEAGEHDSAALLSVGLLNSSLKVGGAHLHGQRDRAFFQFFAAFHTHFNFPPFTVAV